MTKELIKAELFDAWGKLIDVLYDYLQVVRLRGGTMGFKVGGFYNDQKGKPEKFKTNIKKNSLLF